MTAGKRIILNLDPRLGETARGRLAAAGRVVDVARPEDLPERLRGRVAAVMARLGKRITDRQLSLFENLKAVASATTGLDHIDTDYCAGRNVAVISLKGETAFLENIHATPEMTWALLLALVRKLPRAAAAVHRGEWRNTLFVGNELFRKTMGIVGFGRVGRIVGRYAHAFGMKVLFHNDVRPSPVDYPCRRVSLAALLKASDVVSLHLPLNGKTAGCFKREHFHSMKPGAFFVNTARGALVDEAALLEALEKKAIAGAALDVLAGENAPGGVSAAHPLVAYARAHDNLVISPHIAGSTAESMEDTSVFVAEKLRKFLRTIIPMVVFMLVGGGSKWSG